VNVVFLEIYKGWQVASSLTEVSQWSQRCLKSSAVGQMNVFSGTEDTGMASRGWTSVNTILGVLLAMHLWKALVVWRVAIPSP